ncbi:hypothetical protein KEM52_005598 [Ascosphaera acerosa]|nr:hypothetical protein KEM52_005598 [Ascosphaera acerosa]
MGCDVLQQRLAQVEERLVEHHRLLRTLIEWEETSRANMSSKRSYFQALTGTSTSTATATATTTATAAAIATANATSDITSASSAVQARTDADGMGIGAGLRRTQGVQGGGGGGGGAGGRGLGSHARTTAGATTSSTPMLPLFSTSMDSLPFSDTLSPTTTTDMEIPPPSIAETESSSSVNVARMKTALANKCKRLNRRMKFTEIRARAFSPKNRLSRE